MRQWSVYIFLYCFCCALPGALGQDVQALPKMERSYVNYFYLEDDSYSRKCFSDIFFDRRGRLWLVPCGVERLINSIGLFRFDGYSFEPAEVLTPGRGVVEAPLVRAVTEDGRFWGSTANGELFMMSPETQEGRLLSPGGAYPAGFQIMDLSVRGNEVHGLTRTGEHSMTLFRVKGDTLKKEADFEYSFGEKQLTLQKMFLTQKDVWVLGLSLPLHRFDRQSGKVRAYGPSDFTGETIKPTDKRTLVGERLSKLLESPRGNTYLALSVKYENRLFQFDSEKDQFICIAEQFQADWRPAGIFQDETGNICFLFRDKSEVYRAILETTRGERFDYSSVVAGKTDIVRLAGKDFRRQVFLLTNNGLYCAGLREKDVIRQALKDKWISSMASLPDGRLLINTVDEGWFAYDETTGSTVPFQGTDCGTHHLTFGKGMKQQIIPDDRGNLWFLSHRHLVKYHPATNDCSIFDLGSSSSLFAFVREGLVIYQHKRLGISFFDLHTQEQVSFGPGIPEKLNGFIRDILVDSKGILWIPTNNGLWRIDIDEGKSEVLGLKHGFADFRFTSIFEDARGRLWLGTYFGGLHIYDPQTGAITIIDRGRGLSNNTIMSIIADDEGDMWVGTEYGINLVSHEGEVLNSFHREDGLTYEIFERFDPFKSRNGRLYFGSRKGISIIDPAALKAYMKSDTTVRIYLTELRYFDKKKGVEVVQKSHFEHIGRLEMMKTGTISALNRSSISVAFRPANTAS